MAPVALPESPGEARLGGTWSPWEIPIRIPPGISRKAAAGPKGSEDIGNCAQESH